MEPKSDLFFEISWEVCNKVGGIYSVITSKAKQMLSAYKENYYAVGPFFSGKTYAGEFTHKEPPAVLKQVFEKLHKEGIMCIFGTWLIEGEPNTILIDYSNYKHKINDIKGEYWNNFKIDSLHSQYHDYDEPILWSSCVGMLIEEIKKIESKRKIVAQTHEWLAGGALLYLKSRKVNVGTVFTTHATMLGRTLAANDVDIYGNLDKIKPEEEAYKHGIQDKFLTEKACALNADAFTTVSEITGIEAAAFFGKKPDVLLFNGNDTKIFPTFDEASIQHKVLKNKLKKFMMFYFFPYYQFDLDNTLFYFLAGRYEFKNKGVDLYIDALKNLNDELKAKKSQTNVVAFIWVPAGVKEIKPEILESRTFFEDVYDSVHDAAEDVKDRLVYGMLSKSKIDDTFLLGENAQKVISRKVTKLKREGNPPLCTHNLYNESNDVILNTLKQKGLNNSKEDNVKVIFYPIYLGGADRLTDLNYFEGIMACHLGVFPSYYEPWGYTPMETGSLGVASITTDLAGFGRYIKKHANGKNPGIYVLEREGKTYEHSLNSLSNMFLKFAEGSKQDRIENKLKAKNLADMADWNKLAENYIKAHNIAIDKINQK